MKKLASLALFLPLAAAWPAAAQTWDTSGNNLLNGTYYFRQVVWAVEDNEGDVGEAISLYGTINFNGNGQYTVSSVQVMDSSGNGSPCTIGQSNCSGYGNSGTYSVASSGYGFLDSLITTDEVYGLVSNGIFIASSTENSACQSNSNAPCYNDLFIAVPVPTTPFSNSAFQGTYSMADLDITAVGSQNGIVYTRGSTFQISPNGSGGIPGFPATGYITTNGSTKTVQNVSSTNYTFSNSAANWSIGGSISNSNAGNVLIAGTKYLYFSPDGNFVFGGSPTGWDMIVGVRTSTGGSASFSGLYYQAGALVDNSELSSSEPEADLVTYYGSYCVGSCTGSNTILQHQRLDDALFGGGFAYDYTYSDSLSSANGIYSDIANQYVFTNGGAIGIGFPTISSAGAQLGVTVLLRSPSFSGQGVYVYPTGVLNAGSSAPFTAQFAPGELISIYGTNLASTTLTDLTLPTTLGNVQVLVNGQPAPIAYVSATQINAVIPIGLSPGTIASVQVVNHGTNSNVVTNYVGETQPGVFNSLTAPAVQHANYSMVTSSSPAQPGETLLVYLTGLGQLSSGNASNTITAYFEDPKNGNLQATVSFAGSQSTVGGGYQINVVVPSGITTGNLYVDVSGPDSYNSEIVIPIGSAGSTATIRKSAQIRPRMAKDRIKPKYRRRPSA
ncbi:MAG: hypothetical protein JO323_21325 [Acidobacteriia bacterium]|nr:hypothetical protein [Terriglobia bacterium]